MHLVTGPAGAGKTARVLDQFRRSLRERDQAVRLLVPTATMVRHLRNQFAREGFVLRPECIQTLSGFVSDWVDSPPQVPDATLYLIVEQAIHRLQRPEFAKVAGMPGFCASVARTISEFSSAGCDSERLARHLPDAPLGPAFLAVYREVDRELAARGFAMRAARLALASERISRDGLPGIRTIWLDGFHELPDPELAFLQALGRHAEVTLTFEAIDARLAAAGFREERLSKSRPAAQLALVRAPSIEREVEEIARRILEQSASRPFREIGIIVRAKDTYLPILRSTLERFGIPARFYFEAPLAEHASIRFLVSAVDAMLGGWDHAATLAVLKLFPRFADSPAMDEFDFAVREVLPDSGLGALKALAATDNLHHLIDQLAALEEWRSFALTPRDWAARVRDLRTVFLAEPSLPPLILQSQAAALAQFEQALTETAQALDSPHPIPLEAFWRAFQAVLRLAPLRLDDARRNVVHVLSAPEARQWVLPVVFICGMIEKQFPQFHTQDPFFPDSARCRLNDAGIRVRTAAEFEREEHALFESAVSRATILTTLSYPEFDSRGDRNLSSIFLEELVLDAQPSRSVRPLPRREPAPRPPVRIEAPALIEFLRVKTARVTPTGLETYLQCPFEFFGNRILRLRSAPARPDQRLDFLTQGEIVHGVLAALPTRSPDHLEPVFESVFATACEQKRIPRAYHTERLRNAMLADLHAFLADGKWPGSGFTSRTELPFTLPLDSVEISGKIDRLDVAPDGRAYVIDYKYSGAPRTRSRLTDPNLLQAPLYLMAAEKVFGHQAAGMFYIGLKKEILYVGWSDAPVAGLAHHPLPANWLAETGQRTLSVLQEIRSGRIEVAPANPGHCRHCDCRDICRVSIRQAEAVEEGA
jgi:ATP-dependent helicase/DNAse subunit B